MGESLFLSTTPGLEVVLLAEAQPLGSAKLVPGGVKLGGPDGLHRRANLELRTASRVMIELGELKVRDPADLRRALGGLDLRPYVRRGEAVELELVARGGMGERGLREGALGIAPAAGVPATAAAPRPLGPLVRLRSERGAVWVSVDTSGELLYRRGYRQEVSHAPLRETLAAGLLALSEHTPDVPLWDPLCGSGTLLIEAALHAKQHAPGLARSFAFERFPAHDKNAFAREKAAAFARERPLATPLFGSDLNAGALGTARRNARRAGVEGELRLTRHDASLPFPGVPAGTLALANFPYGKRLLDKEALPTLYAAIAKGLRRSGVARLGALVADERAGEWLSLREPRVHALDNGGLSCWLLVGGL